MNDRKAMIREYKERPRTMGVGVVRNRSNGKVLVVAGNDLPALLNRHRAQLRLASHRNRAMQSDWKAHGADAFEFEIVDTLTPGKEPDYDPSADLQALEAMWVEKLQPFEPAGYQIRPK